MSHWQNEPLVVNSLEQLKGLVGRRIATIERYALSGYVRPGERGSEREFEFGEGSVCLRFVDSPEMVMFWGHESAQTLAVSVDDEDEPEDPLEGFELVATSDDFPKWLSIRDRTIDECGLLDWNRGERYAGYPDGGGVYFRLDERTEVLIAYQLVSRAEDLVRLSSLAPHLKNQLRYTAVDPG